MCVLFLAAPVDYKCLKTLFDALARRIHIFACNELSASLILEIAYISFFPYFEIKIVFASQIGFYYSFGTRSIIISAKASPYLYSL